MDNPDELKTEVVYKTDTVYVYELPDEQKYPWDLLCEDTADTQLDMNICSRERYLIADSLTQMIYEEMLNSAKVTMDKTASSGSGYYSDQSSRIEKIHAHFRIIRDEASAYKSAAYEGGSIEPLMANNIETLILEMEYELLKAMRFEIEDM